jgi:hypothetical protein
LQSIFFLLTVQNRLKPEYEEKYLVPLWQLSLFPKPLIIRYMYLGHVLFVWPKKKKKKNRWDCSKERGKRTMRSIRAVGLARFFLSLSGLAGQTMHDCWDTMVKAQCGQQMEYDGFICQLGDQLGS